MRPHIEHLSAEHEITVVSNYAAAPPAADAHAAYLHAPLARQIEPLNDLRAVHRLWSLFRRQHFDAVLSVTPKAGLLGMLAARLAGTPVRIHWFTGQVWATRSGLARHAFKNADRLIAGLASHLLADSPSQRDFLAREGVCRTEKVEVLGDGSICGVDDTRFRPDAAARQSVRQEHAIPSDAPLVLFLGRLNRDKGIRELADAMLLLDERFPQLHWLIVGPDEGGMVDHVRSVAGRLGDRLHFQGFTAAPQNYMAAADIFCLPSYREGFGSSALEAAATGIPSVATRIYGLTDAVEDGVSGILVPPRDATALAAGLERLLADPELRQKMGLTARKRALKRFSRQRITSELHAFLQRALQQGPT